MTSIWQQLLFGKVQLPQLNRFLTLIIQPDLRHRCIIVVQPLLYLNLVQVRNVTLAAMWDSSAFNYQSQNTLLLLNVYTCVEISKFSDFKKEPVEINRLNKERGFLNLWRHSNFVFRFHSWLWQTSTMFVVSNSILNSSPTLNPQIYWCLLTIWKQMSIIRAFVLIHFPPQSYFQTSNFQPYALRHYTGECQNFKRH